MIQAFDPILESSQFSAKEIDWAAKELVSKRSPRVIPEAGLHGI